MGKRWLLVTAVLLALGTAAQAAGIVLDWNENTEPDMANYCLFKSTRSLLSATTTQAAVDASVTKTVIPHPTITASVANLTPGVTYYFRLTAIDDAGNESAFNLDSNGQASEVSTCPAVSDTTPPAVSITQPANNATVSGTVAIAATATDGGGVAGVTFYLGAGRLSDDTSSPYSHAWNTTALANGSYALTAVARDASGNVSTSSVVNVTVSNVAVDASSPVISGVTASNVRQTSAVITWTTNEPADTQINYGTATSYGQSSALDGARAATHSVTLSGLLPGRLYNYRARSRDAAGNLALSGNFTFNTPAVPRLTVTAPAAGATLTGTTVQVVYSRAGDLSEANHIHFQLNGGATIEETDNNGLLSLSGFAPGAHTLTGYLVRSDHSKINGTDASVSFNTIVPLRNLGLKLVKAPPSTMVNLIGSLVEVRAQLVDEDTGMPLPPNPSGPAVRLRVTDDSGAKAPINLRLLPGGIYGGTIDTGDLSVANGPASYYCETTDPGDLSVSVLSDVMTLWWDTSVTLRPDGGDPTVLSAPDGNSADGDFSVRLPKGVALAEVSLSRVPEPAAAAAEEGPRLIAAYDFSVPGHASYTFNKPVALTIVWRDADGTDADDDGVPDGDGREDSTGVGETDFKLYWLDGQGRWKLVGGVVDPAKNSITAKTYHFSIYAVFANAAPPADPVRASEIFLSPALADGRNDVATFGPEAEEVTVYDVNGQVHFQAAKREMSQSSLTWNCRDERGRMVSSGVYIAKVRTADGKTVYQTLTVVK